ncbi:hypothetical protein ACTFIY_002994 [Dictyostelium cf. discoideum]
MKFRIYQIIIIIIVIIISFNIIILLNNQNVIKLNNSKNYSSNSNSNINIKNIKIEIENKDKLIIKEKQNDNDKKKNEKLIVKEDELNFSNGFKPKSKILNINKRETILSRECNFVDLVYTWVNGSDADHMETKKQVIFNLTGEQIQDFEPHRYRDIGGLKYSLRSVRKYAPWIRNIYVITANQVPTWFNSENPENVKFIFHKNYYGNISHLPTYSSNSIESNFWNLPNEVSNCFLYLNDDVFFNRPVEKSDYFYDDQFNQKIYEIQERTQVFNEQKKLEPYAKSFAYSNSILNKIWGEDKRRFLPDHGVQVYNKKIWLMIHDQLFDFGLDQTSSNRFRESSDLQLSFIYNQFAKRYSNQFKLASKGANLYVGIWNDEKIINNAINRILNEKNAMTICLNDGFDFVDDEIHSKLTNLFDTLFPEKSPFEK